MAAQGKPARWEALRQVGARVVPMAQAAEAVLRPIFPLEAGVAVG